MAGILVYSEKQEIGWELLGRAKALQGALGGQVSLCLLGPEAESAAQAGLEHGAEVVYISADPALAGLANDVMAAALQQAVERSGAETVLIGSTLRGKALAPRLAQKLGAGCVTDATGLVVEKDRLVAHRYGYGGKTIAEEAFATPRQVVALLPRHVWADASQPASGRIETLSLSLPPSRLRVVERKPKAEDGGDIESAERLVGAGRGLRRQEDLALLQELARALGAAVACTRTLAYDLRWLPESQLIGLSGKKCAPRLYLGVGVSGQVQHMMGITGARIIAAINSDKDAPIFESADYGVVGDLYQVVPKLIEELKK